MYLDLNSAFIWWLERNWISKFLKAIFLSGSPSTYAQLSRFRNFIFRQITYGRFLHPNEYSQKIIWFLVTCKDVQILGIFKLIFIWRINFVFLKMISVKEYQIRRTTFVRKYISNFIQIKKILAKNVPHFCRLSTGLFFKIWKKKSLRRFIWLQKYIEIYLLHLETS